MTNTLLSTIDADLNKRMRSDEIIEPADGLMMKKLADLCYGTVCKREDSTDGYKTYQKKDEALDLMEIKLLCGALEISIKEQK